MITLSPTAVLAAVLTLDASEAETVGRWLTRGDGVAVYENVDLSSATLGSRQYVSFGSEHAQLETEEPPEQLPDIGGRINWRYRLVGSYRPSERRAA